MSLAQVKILIGTPFRTKVTQYGHSEPCRNIFGLLIKVGTFGIIETLHGGSLNFDSLLR